MGVSENRAFLHTPNCNVYPFQEGLTTMGFGYSISSKAIFREYVLMNHQHICDFCPHHASLYITYLQYIIFCVFISVYIFTYIYITVYHLMCVYMYIYIYVHSNTVIMSRKVSLTQRSLLQELPIRQEIFRNHPSFFRNDSSHLSHKVVVPHSWLSWLTTRLFMVCGRYTYSFY